MKTSEFWYDLPQELIAQCPIEPRDHSRLMAVDRQSGQVAHRHFYDIVEYLNPGDALVINDTRVMPARLLGHREPGGGAAEVLGPPQVRAGLARFARMVRPPLHSACFPSH